MIKSIKIGNIAEKLLIKILSENGIAAKKNEDVKTRSFFDISADFAGHNVTFEVKYDLMAAKTGNIAIEYFNSKSNKPSGIGVTKADYWIHVVHIDNNDIIYMCSVDSLKYFIDTVKPKRKISSGGDKNSDMLLYSIKDVSCFKLFDIKDIKV